MAMAMPLDIALAVHERGWDEFQRSGLGGGFAMIGLSGALLIVSLPPLMVLTPLYVFLFWRSKERGVVLSRRYWLPIYGSLFLVVTFAILLLWRL
jgi:hypothetical protein